MKTVRFYKDNREWFADVAGHTKSENQMVAGSDIFLDEMDNALGKRGEVSIDVSDSVDVGSAPFIAKLNMRAHNQWGATYVLTGPLAEQCGATGFQLWICNVTHDVLGEHPKAIYIFDIR